MFTLAALRSKDLIILSVDDHRLFSEGLRMMITQLDPKLEFLQATCCSDALALDPKGIRTVLLDYHLPDVEEFDGLVRLREHFTDSNIVIISGEEKPQIIKQTIALGAAGFIPKSSEPEVLIAALQLVLAGGVYLPPHVLGATEPEPPAERDTILKQLSDRQVRVLKGAVQGKLNKVIAAELDIAEGTVKAHLSAAFKALGVKDRTGAVFAASKLDLHRD